MKRWVEKLYSPKYKESTSAVMVHRNDRPEEELMSHGHNGHELRNQGGTQTQV